MATYTKVLLSGSTNGKHIKIAATSGTGTLIHTATSGTTNLDEVWLYAINEYTSAIVLTLQWGGTTAVDHTVTVSIPATSGLQLIMPGILLQNSLEIRAYAATANQVLITGFVNRIAP